MHIEGASTPLLSTSAAPQVHGNIGTDNQELHSVLSHHTDTSYGTEFFAELDSLEGRQMHGGSVSRSHALGRPSDSPCDSEFLRKIDEFEQAHISLLPTATPIGKAQVETLDKGLFCGNELQTLGTTQQHIGVEMSRLCELQTPKHGTRYDDQGTDIAPLLSMIQIYSMQKMFNLVNTLESPQHYYEDEEFTASSPFEN